MNIPVSTLIITGLFFLIIFASGYRLHFAGRPFSTLLLNAHKLIGLAAAAFLFVTINRLRQAVPISPPALAAALTAGLLFLTTIVTGGLVSLPKPPPPAVSLLHHLFPYLTLLASAAALFFLE